MDTGHIRHAGSPRSAADRADRANAVSPAWEKLPLSCRSSRLLPPALRERWLILDGLNRVHMMQARRVRDRYGLSLLQPPVLIFAYGERSDVLPGIGSEYFYRHAVPCSSQAWSQAGVCCSNAPLPGQARPLRAAQGQHPPAQYDARLPQVMPAPHGQQEWIRYKEQAQQQQRD